MEFLVETPFENLHLMRSHPQLEELQSKLESRQKIYKLREALDELADEYDQVWIDTPPALNFFTRSALVASQGCLIPFDCDDFSRRALYALLENVQEIQADHNRQLKVDGIVVNQYQPRANLPQKMVQGLIDEGLPVLRPYLSSSVKMKESHEQALPMIHLDPKHKLTLEFVALHDGLSAS
jgi:chromosome partitioning protein